MYNSLNHFDKIEKDLQLHFHKQITTRYGRNMENLYYDGTNYFFNTGIEDELRKMDTVKKEDKIHFAKGMDFR